MFCPLALLKEKQMQGLFSVHPLFCLRDRIWLCVGMKPRTWITSVSVGAGLCVYVCVREQLSSQL